MKINDQQFGRPQILYKATKTQIEATPNPQAGMIAFATDTNQIGIYTSGGWQWGTGGGDMLKAIYDTDNDGVVDAAESVDWAGVQNKPTTYPPDSHNHAAGDVTSGVLDAARIPNLDASKITSGTLSTDRFSAYSDLQAESRIGGTSNQVVTSYYMRREYYRATITHDFDNALPSGWSWAGAPFVIPTINYLGGTLLTISPGAGNRAFLTSGSSYLAQSKWINGIFLETDASSPNTYIGYRTDDGTEDNYLEIVLVGTTLPNMQIKSRVRSGGGVVTETTHATFQRCWIEYLGIIYAGSSYQIVVYEPARVAYSPYLTPAFTPSRCGIICSTSASWQIMAIDGIGGVW
ncbi:MAG: hypothetical protein KatS3mg047_1038 [Bellilinea sp.]|nr:MAG: hypothetical protein KatS3mg047_1038 [Bellilinea sp.]